MTEEKIQYTHCIQSYSSEGYKMKGRFIKNKIYNDQALILYLIYKFTNIADIKTLEFCIYKGFNAAKVTEENGKCFWLTIEEFNGYED